MKSTIPFITKTEFWEELCGYERSRTHDVDNCRYNPLNDVVWDFTEKKEFLEKIIQSHPVEKLDTILPEINLFIRRW